MDYSVQQIDYIILSLACMSSAMSARTIAGFRKCCSMLNQEIYVALSGWA